MTGQVILVSGTSGSGKTTACATWAKTAAAPYLHFGLDLLVGTLFPPQYTIFGKKSREGYGGNTFGPEMGWPALHAMHEMIAAAARSGQNMIVDHMMFLDPPILQDVIWSMADIPVLFVNLRPPREILEQRVTTRDITLPPPLLEAAGGPEGVARLGAQLAGLVPWFYEHTYANDLYDLTINSGEHGPAQICALIAARLQQGPATAFKELRARYPKT